MRKFTMNGTSSRHLVTRVVEVNKETSVITTLKTCSDFKIEQTQIAYTLDLLGIKV